ncbi:MAG: adenylyltransferase/cytidyltransferase family protein [Candidatus Pacebacteria bacterium]|nr:adenylyltransferase/cytidyltransferase family protein [Candidatus Paceibacterota bacterium]MDD5356559.1 adenylyltransferase/cytidyltransferase family protein [Candidatus Paceibacterota bacterium]
MKKNKKEIVVVTSGGFDPLHIGHIRLFEESKKLGDKLIIILNNDNWLLKKKGCVFMPETERKEIIEALRMVDEVVLTKHPENPNDMSICHMLEEIRPDILSKGGDRDQKDANKASSSLNPEQKLCKRLGIKLVFNVGRGGKVQSSSWLIAKVKDSKK